MHNFDGMIDKLFTMHFDDGLFEKWFDRENEFMYSGAHIDRMKNKTIFTMEVPGVRKECIHITEADQDHIRIKIYQEGHRLSGYEGTVYCEDIDYDNVEATCVDGILTVVCPKSNKPEAQKVRTIEIK